MKSSIADFPLRIKISFSKLFDKYEELLKTGSPQMKARAKSVLEMKKKHPKLVEGLEWNDEVQEYMEQIDFLLEDIFPPALQLNEIKTATIPFQKYVFKSTQRYKNIVAAGGDDLDLSLANFDDSNQYIMGCSIILNMYYGFKADFRRPFFYNIPDKKGIMHYYKVLFNADFLEIEKTEKAKDITEEDYLELLESSGNVELWKEKFPPGSWVSKGFIIANLFDATMDFSLSKLKESLLQSETYSESFIDEFRTIIKSIFNLSDVKIGYTVFNEEDDSFYTPEHRPDISSYILNGKMNTPCGTALCSRSFRTLFEDHKAYCISDVDYYFGLYPDNILYKTLHDQGIKSSIISSIVVDGKVKGIIELVSYNIHELNSINATKLKDVMPFLVDAVRRSNERMENELELIIQRECTAIHPSVHWKFKEEAKRFYKGQLLENPTAYRAVVFKDVYPLYGQMDIKGSARARNEATKQDLILQLKHVRKIIAGIYKLDKLPIYEQLDFRIKSYLKEISERMQVDSERSVLNFLMNEIIPLYEHLSEKSPAIKKLIDNYYKVIDADKGFIYNHRRDYDETVMMINKKMAAILDSKQIEAQKMYPHYFERFKTDGVEHNLYIGEAITRQNNFNKIYLYNLRLWQLQVMCEMENCFYKMKEDLPMPLNVASMILAYNTSLSLRFRMDEKRFDVDGTYNARYEVVKKRVDKANIKGTNERITQPGKIAIIYSQVEDEQEYLKYISFLQSKKQLVDDAEIVELEDLVGVTGLKAIRVSVLYSKKKDNKKEYYTYDDLMQEIAPD